MKTEDKCTSRELSEKLRDAGYKQESDRNWLQGVNGGWYLTQYHKDTSAPKLAAPCVTELLDGMPAGSCVQKLPPDDVVNGRIYEADCPELENYSVDDGRTPVEALGKLKLWLLENGHVEE